MGLGLSGNLACSSMTSKLSRGIPQISFYFQCHNKIIWKSHLFSC